GRGYKSHDPYFCAQQGNRGETIDHVTNRPDFYSGASLGVKRGLLPEGK
ncbi:unnamed protein product, partial [marine sediment metagenome]